MHGLALHLKKAWSCCIVWPLKMIFISLVFVSFEHDQWPFALVMLLLFHTRDEALITFLLCKQHLRKLSKSSSLSVQFSTKQDNWWYMVAKPPYSWHFDVALLYCIDELEVILNNMLTTNYIKFEKTLHVKDTANKPNPCHVELFPVNAWWYFIYLFSLMQVWKIIVNFGLTLGSALLKRLPFMPKPIWSPKVKTLQLSFMF